MHGSDAMTTTTMRWLILPDIHDKLRRANQIIEREPHDRLLLMGDFFDDFRTGVTDAADTNLRHYAVFDGGKLEIKSHDELMVAAKTK